MTITDEQLEALIAAGGRATKRPWVVQHKSNLIRGLCGVYAEGQLPLVGDEVAGRCMQENAIYIAQAANLAVLLAREVKELRAERERLRYAANMCLDVLTLENPLSETAALRSELRRRVEEVLRG